jgi:hypothetical protein
MKHQRFFPLVLFSGLLLCFTVSLAEAQRLTGTIRGTVTDETGAVLPGAAVDIESPALIGGVQSMITTDSGVYHFPALAPGTYTATYSMQGFQVIRREGIVVTIGTTTTVNITLSISTVEETVTVTGESPVVDLTKSGTTTNFKVELLENLPLTRFTYIDILQMAPGVSANETQGEEWHSSLGSNYWSDAYLVDGVDTSFDWNGTTWVWNNPDTYEEAEVFAIGAPAEYGNFQGAVVNVITKSGGNTFTGQASGHITPSGAVDNNVPDAEYPYHIDHWRDLSFDLGGPINTDSLWFYGNYQYKRFAYSQLGTPADMPTKGEYDRFFGKITSQIGAKNRLMGAYQYEEYYLPDVITAASPFDATAVEPGDYQVANVMWTSTLSPNTLMEIKFGGWWANDSWVPMDGNLDDSQHADLGTGFVSNGIWGWSSGKASRTQFNVSLSHYADQFIKGNHDLKFGVQYSRGTNDGTYSYSGGVGYYDYFGEPYSAYLQNPYNYGLAVHKIGAFVDDAWSVSDRLTLNLGLRFDRQDGDIWDVDELDMTGNPTGSTIQGIPDLIAWSNWSPRLGMVYQLTEDQKTTLRVNYGHYYEGLFLATLWRMNTSGQPVTGYLYNWDTGQYDIESYYWEPVGARGIGDDLNNSLARQFSLGVSRELFTGFGVDVTFFFKQTKDLLSWWNETGEFGLVDYPDEYSGQTIQVWNQLNDPSDDFLLLQNRSEHKQRYRGVFIAANKRLSNNWQMSGSVAISKAYGVSNPSQLTQGDFSGLTDPNNLVNNSGWEGLLQSDRTYMFKLQGSYFFPHDISVSAGYIAQTGKPLVRSIQVLGMNQRTFTVNAEPRGSVWRLDGWNLLDLRIEKVFRFGERFRVSIAGDIFNAFNTDTMIETASTRGLSEEFMQPARIEAPRRLQLVFKLKF